MAPKCVRGDAGPTMVATIFSWCGGREPETIPLLQVRVASPRTGLVNLRQPLMFNGVRTQAHTRARGRNFRLRRRLQDEAVSLHLYAPKAEPLRSVHCPAASPPAAPRRCAAVREAHPLPNEPVRAPPGLCGTATPALFTAGKWHRVFTAGPRHAAFLHVKADGRRRLDSHRQTAPSSGQPAARIRCRGSERTERSRRTGRQIKR